MLKTRLFVNKAIVILVGGALLAGCGGGGSDDGDSSSKTSSPVPEPSLSLSQSSLTLPEGDSETVSLDYNDGSDLTIDVQGEGASVAFTMNNDRLQVSASQVDRPRIVEIVVSATLGEKKVSKTLSISIENTSAEAVVSKAKALLSEEQPLLGLSQDKQIYHFFVDFAYLGGAISSSDKTTLLAQFDAQGQTSYQTLNDQLHTLSVVAGDYQRGNISDSRLSATIDQTESLALEHAAYGRNRLNAISDFSDVVVPGFAAQPMAFDVNSGIYSRFLSNTMFGEYVNGGYRFNDTYAALSHIVRMSASDSAVCGVL
jgi:hypothetical protein